MTLINKTTTTKNKFQHPGTHERRRHYSSNWPNARSNSSVVPLPPQECPPWTTSMNNYKFLPWVLSSLSFLTNTHSVVPTPVVKSPVPSFMNRHDNTNVLFLPTVSWYDRGVIAWEDECIKSIAKHAQRASEWSRAQAQVIGYFRQLSSATIVEEWG